MAEEKKTVLDQRVEAQLSEAEQKNDADGNTAGTDVYSGVKKRDPETGVEIPTEEAVLEAKEWSDKENQM